MYGRTRSRVASIGLVLAAVVALAPSGAVSSSAASAQRGPRIKAHLTVKKLAPAQADEVSLSYRFLRPSSRFALLLERKHGARWLQLRRVRLEGRFRGAHTSTVAELFGKRPLKLGLYRLKLSADGGPAVVMFSLVAARPLGGVTSVSAGGRLTCATLSDGGVDCWGFNQDGELGNSSSTDSPTPVAVGGITSAVTVQTGYRHACAVLQDGMLSCWGYNHGGELGNGTTDNSAVPVAVGGLTGAVASSSGGGFTCAVITGGTVSCWGDNETGELGIGTVTSVEPYGMTAPVQVSQITSATGVSAGFLHTCALISGGTIDCWGYNADGQVGNGTVTQFRPHAVTSPVQVMSIANAVAVSSGAFHTCALLAGGRVDCWGFNEDGELGDRKLDNSAIPVRVAGMRRAVEVAAGGFHACALISGGAVECWGKNDYGQLGDGTRKNSSLPVRVVGIDDAVSISAGDFHSCAVLRDGTVKCWGLNRYGQLGSGTLASSTVPITVVTPF